MRKNVCTNRVLDGDETDVDCGGTCSTKCSRGLDCEIDNDCKSSLKCISKLCAEEDSVASTPSAEEDHDEDGISDEWEMQYGLDPSDPSDAELDFDEDGLTNLQEFTYGTNPNNADSDQDSFADKEEIKVDTDPSDSVSKPGGIGGLLIWVVVLVIFGAAGSYGYHYHKDFFLRLIGRGTPEPSYIPAPIPEVRPKLQRPAAPRKNLEKIKIAEVVTKRREKKRGEREKFFEIFGKKKIVKKAKPLVSVRKSKIKKIIIKEPKKDDVFTKLELISKKEEEKRKSK
jgi:hypothetical protein